MAVVTRDRTRALPPVNYPGNVAGVLYEPRAFWGVAQLANTGRNLDEPQRFVFPREFFLNAERYPVTVTKINIAPIGYVFREFANGAPVDAQTYRSGGSAAFNNSKLRISMPQRKSFSRQELALSAYTALPTWEPNMRNVINPATNVSLGYAGALWGVYQWIFEHPMIMARLGTLELQFATIDGPAFDVDADLEDVHFNVAFYEGPPPVPSGQPEGPGRLLWPGNARVSTQLRTSAPIEGDKIVHYNSIDGSSQSIIAVPRDPNWGGGGVNAGAIGNLSPLLYDPRDQFSTVRYDRKNANVAGPAPVTGFSIHLDQIAYDDAIENVPLPGNPGGQPISPIGLKTGVRVRTTNGGTNTWWARNDVDGWIPTALMMPTITPAEVYRLPRPITLEQGDAFEVELEVPGPIVIEDSSPIEQTYTIGLSFTGFATVSG